MGPAHSIVGLLGLIRMERIAQSCGTHNMPIRVVLLVTCSAMSRYYDAHQANTEACAQ